MKQETLEMIKKEKTMSVVLVFLLILFSFVVVFVMANKKYDDVIEEPIDKFDASNYVRLENVDNTDYMTVYNSVDLKRVTFSNFEDVLISDFYNKQDQILNELSNNISSNKEYIDNYNNANNITDYVSDSKIESLILYELKDDILSLLYLVEDTVEHRGVNNYITNIFIDIKNNVILNTDGLLSKYNYTKEIVSSLVFDAVLEKHDDSFEYITEGEVVDKNTILDSKAEYVRNIVNDFDNYIYLYFNQGNLYLKYNRSDITNKLFNENLSGERYSTLKLQINDNIDNLDNDNSNNNKNNEADEINNNVDNTVNDNNNVDNNVNDSDNSIDDSVTDDNNTDTVDNIESSDNN